MHDVAELLGGRKPSLRLERVSHLLPIRGRFRSQLAGRIDSILRIQRGYQ